MPMNKSRMSLSRATRPLIRYSLCPERYRRRPTTTSPGRKLIDGCFSAARFFQCGFLPFSETSGADPVDASAAAASATGSAMTSSVVSPSAAGIAATASGTPSITLATASDSSGSTSVRLTSEMPIGGRLAVPLKMQSDMRSARSILWLCSPRTQEMASTTLDLPQPFGPTMQVMPLPLKVIGVFSQNDLKPSSSTLRSFSTQPSHANPFELLQKKGVRSEFFQTFIETKRSEGSDIDGPAAWR